MENLLPQGPKDIIAAVLAAAAAGAIIYLGAAALSPASIDGQNVYPSVRNDIRIVENTLREKNREYRNRAETLFEKYRSNTLRHSMLNAKEALLAEQDGVIKNYFGEIYEYKYREVQDLETGDWTFIGNKDIYYARKMADHMFYIRYFCSLENSILLERMKFRFPVCELKYSNFPAPVHENKYDYNEKKGMFFYDHLLEHANNRLSLHLEFSGTDIEAYYNRKYKIYLWLAVLFFLLICIFYFYNRNVLLTRLLWLALPMDLFFLLPMLGKNNLYLYLSIDVLDIRLGFVSIFQVLAIPAFFILVLYFLRERF